MSIKQWKSDFGKGVPAVDMPEQLEDMLAADIESPRPDGAGIAVKHGQAGLLVEDEAGNFHGIFYAQLRGRVQLDKAQTRIVVPFEEEDGVYDLVIDGRELKVLARHLTLTQRVTLQAGGMVSSVRVVKRDED